MTTTTDYMTQVSPRRKLMELIDAEGDREYSYISVWVDGIQIAAGVRQSPDFADYHKGYRWQLWSSGLVLPPSTFYGDAEGTPRAANAASPIAVRDEADVRAWLNLLADLAERGPTAVDRYATIRAVADDEEE